MAIVIRHATLSEKTQSAISGIISKNEWNAIHTLVEPILEADIQFSPTGHNHNGSNSNVAARAVAIQDSTSTSFYRVASPKPINDMIPILDGSGNLNIRRINTTPINNVSAIQFYDFNGTTLRGSLYFQYNEPANGGAGRYPHLNIVNNTSGHAITLYDNADIHINPGGSYGIYNVAKNNYILNEQASDGNTGNYAQILFSDSTYSPRGYIRHQYSTNLTNDYISMRHNISNAFVALDGNGDVAINSQGVGKKAYYIQSNGAFTTGREIVVRDDIKTLGFSYTSQAVFDANGNWVVPAGVTKALFLLKGGGGGGGGGSGASDGSQRGGGGGGGGGEGQEVLLLIDTTVGETFTITVGGGGGGGTGAWNGASSGSAGNPTYVSNGIGNKWMANGGGGGVAGTASSGWGAPNGPGGPGGAGGTGSFYASVLLAQSGGAGGLGYNSNGSGGGAAKYLSLIGSLLATIENNANGVNTKKDGYKLYINGIDGRDGGSGSAGGWYITGGGGGGAGPHAGAGGYGHTSAGLPPGSYGAPGAYGCGGGGGGGCWRVAETAAGNGGAGGTGRVIIWY